MVTNPLFSLKSGYSDLGLIQINPSAQNSDLCGDNACDSVYNLISSLKTRPVLQKHT